LFQYEFRGSDYVLPVCFVTSFCLLGFWTLFSGTPPLILTGISGAGILCELPYEVSYSEFSLVAIGMAVLGSYVWSIQYIARRLIMLDLLPGAYYSVGTRIIFATFISVTLHHFIQSMESGIKNELLELLPVIAFFTGMFPQRVMQYMLEKLMIFQKLGQRAQELPLDMIEGMNLFNKVRLAEVGIDNAQNLAKANLEELILKTPFNPMLLLDWIAQAKLYVIFKNQTAALREAGIRTILDFQAAADEDALNILNEVSKIPEKELAIVHEITSEDPDIAALAAARKNLSKS